MKSFYKILSIAVYILIFFMVMAALGSYALKKPLLLTVIRSNSMYPLIQRGDIILIRPITINSAVELGNIIVFKGNGKNDSGFTDWVMHRAVGGTINEGFITKGDFNKQTDQEDMGSGPIMKERIAGSAITIGKYPLKIPLLGHLPLWVEGFKSKPYVLPILTLILIVILAYSELFGKDKDRKRIKKDNLNTQLIFFFGGLTIAIITGASMLSSSQKLNLDYQVSDTSRGVTMASNIGIIKQGDILEKPLIEISNKGFLPVVATITTYDPQITFSDDLILVKPREAKIETTFRVEASNVGKYSSTIWAGMFFPFLPPRITFWLAQKNFWLALIILSLIPSTPVMLYPLYDAKLRRKTVKIVSRKFRRLKKVFVIGN